MAIKDDVAHNYGHAQSRAYPNSHTHTYIHRQKRRPTQVFAETRQDKASIKTMLRYKSVWPDCVNILSRLCEYYA